MCREGSVDRVIKLVLLHEYKVLESHGKPPQMFYTNLWYVVAPT